jgi:hypothetical protein
LLQSARAENASRNYSVITRRGAKGSTIGAAGLSDERGV